MPSLYTFAEDSPEWPRQFEQEAARLATLLGDEVVTIHHIGSISVPGLAAKSTTAIVWYRQQTR